MESNSRYQNVLKRFEQLAEELGRPENIKNRDLYRKLARERSEHGASAQFHLWFLRASAKTSQLPI